MTIATRKPRRNASEANPAALSPPDTTPAYMTSRDLAAFVNVAPATPGRWRHSGRPDQPPFVRIGRSVRYERAAVMAWLADRAEAAR